MVNQSPLVTKNLDAPVKFDPEQVKKIIIDYIVRCRYNAFRNSMILYASVHWVGQNIDLSKFELTKDNPYLALKGELWHVFYEDISENRPHYDGTALYKEGNFLNISGRLRENFSLKRW